MAAFRQQHHLGLPDDCKYFDLLYVKPTVSWSILPPPYMPTPAAPWWLAPGAHSYSGGSCCPMQLYRSRCANMYTKNHQSAQLVTLGINATLWKCRRILCKRDNNEHRALADALAPSKQTVEFSMRAPHQRGASLSSARKYHAAAWKQSHGSRHGIGLMLVVLEQHHPARGVIRAVELLVLLTCKLLDRLQFGH